MEPLRFISLTVEGSLPIIRPTAAGPPRESIRSETVFMGLPSTEFLLRPSTRFLYKDCAEFLFMGDKNWRLIEAREKAGFRTARGAALRFHWTPSTYASHENGQTPDLPLKAAQRYAKAFKVSVGWLMTGDDNRAQESQWPGAASHKGAFAPNPVAFIQGLPDDGRLFVRLFDYNGNFRDTTFSLGSVGVIRQKIATVCKWPSPR